MGKIVKGIVLGAAVGAGIRVATDLRSEDDLGAIAPRVAKTAGEAALAGASVGLLLTVRDRRRAKKLARSLKGAAKMRAFAETGLQVALPALQHAFEEARPHVVHAAEVARDRASDAADDLRPRIEKASKRAKKRAKKEWKHAKPQVDKARKQARARAEQASKHAKPHLEKASKQARDKASNVADLAAERAKRALADLDLPTAVIAV